MPLPVEAIAFIAHEAIRAHAIASEDFKMGHWSDMHRVYRDKLQATVKWIIEHPDAGPYATWDFMREGKGHDFDHAATHMQYRTFLLRAVVLSQVNWDEDERKAVA